MTTETRPDLRLSTDRVIAAPVEKVFNAWLDPEMLARFMRPGPDMTVPSAKSDAREGGHFEIIMRAGDQDIPHQGTYQKIARHSQIVFTWESAFSPADSEVTLDLRPEGDGTHITLTHVTFYDEEKRDNHLGGWKNILEALSEAVG
ncbi:MAG: SRPBCC family protein [Cognatishimia sp.]